MAGRGYEELRSCSAAGKEGGSSSSTELGRRITPGPGSPQPSRSLLLLRIVESRVGALPPCTAQPWHLQHSGRGLSPPGGQAPACTLWQRRAWLCLPRRTAMGRHSPMPPTVPPHTAHSLTTPPRTGKQQPAARGQPNPPSTAATGRRHSPPAQHMPAQQRWSYLAHDGVKLVSHQLP